MDLLEAADAVEMDVPTAYWRVTGASVAGASHLKTGQPCQDAFAWERLPDGTLAVAVADGAGSALLGEIGAAVAVQAALQSLRHSLDPLSCTSTEDDSAENPDDPQTVEHEFRGSDLLRAALAAAKDAVEMEAWARQLPERELASTLILILAIPQQVYAAQIGDGAAVAMDADGHLIALTTPAGGEYVNQTTFLLSPNSLESAQVNDWRGEVAHLAVFTDGLQMLALKMPEATPHAPFFTPMFQFAASAEETAAAEAELAAFLRSSRVAERTDDDLTLVVASLASQEG